jgi:hypothetical protein
MMPPSLEEFIPRLLEQLDGISKVEYFTVPALKRAIERAWRGPAPVVEEFPKMLFSSSGSISASTVVYTTAQEATKLSEGWTHTAPPAFEEGFPKWFCERPVPEGGTKRYDLRKCFVRTKEQEEEFFSAIERDDWIRDDSNAWGGRAVAIGELVSERKEALKQMIDTEPLEAAAEAEPAELEAQEADGEIEHA